MYGAVVAGAGKPLFDSAPINGNGATRSASGAFAPPRENFRFLRRSGEKDLTGGQVCYIITTGTLYAGCVLPRVRFMAGAPAKAARRRTGRGKRMINVAIVEDERQAADRLCSLFCRYERERGEKFRVVVFSDPVTFLANYSPDYELIMMDIDMPDLNGMDAVRKLREADREVMVIFVTNLAQYAVKGYEVDAFDFIVKPAVYPEFAMKIDRAVRGLELRRGKNIWISTRGGKKAINTNKLIYVEIMRHAIIYHTEYGDVTGSGTLGGVCEMLEGMPFAQCNRCYLVNLRYVTEVTADALVAGGVRLAVSKTRKKEFMRIFNDYLAGGGDVT